MKRKNSINILKPILLVACAAILSATAGPKNGNGGPSNSWGEWRYKKLLVGFTNSLLVTLNGHAIPPFATNLFDSSAHVYLYGAFDGEVYGAGDLTLQTEDRYAVFNVEVNGSLTTKGNTPNLSFRIDGEGSGTVGGVEGEARLDARFVQTRFIVIAPGGAIPESYYAEGTISGTVKQAKGAALNFEETVQILLDNIPGHFGDASGTAQLKLDLVALDAQRFAGHAHGTNNCFGRYDNEPDDVIAKGSYKAKTGDLTMDLIRALGPRANDIRATMTARVDSAPPGEPIHISNAVMKGKAYGQRILWNGNGAVMPTEP